MEGLSLEYLPWILFAIAIARLVAASKHAADARAEAQRMGERLQATLRLLDERPAAATQRPARAATSRREASRLVAPAL